jgi:hypothetical protein
LNPTLDENKTKSDRERMREVDRECNETLKKVEKGKKTEPMLHVQISPKHIVHIPMVLF